MVCFAMFHKLVLGYKLTYSRVGGVVGEHSFKFFVQFVAYAFVYCLFVLLVTAAYLSEALSDTVCLPYHALMKYQGHIISECLLIFVVSIEWSLCGTISTVS